VNGTCGSKRTTVLHDDGVIVRPGAYTVFTGPRSVFSMSARNGDKSRFHRERKQKIARRERMRKLLNKPPEDSNPANTSARVQPRSAKA
jgi:hypothetical protein